MKNKGMTIVEIVVAFALTSVIVLFLVQIVIFLKDTYVVNAVRSEIVLKQSTISNMINELLSDDKLVNIEQNCGETCIQLIYSDNSSKEINFDVEGNRIIVGSYVSKLPRGSKIENVDIYRQDIFDDAGNSNYFFSINADIVNDLFNDETFKLNALYQSSLSGSDETTDETPSQTICQSFSFTYDGEYKDEDDGAGVHRLKLLTDGKFTLANDAIVDLFLVGGGGAGGSDVNSGGGGGGGYTLTEIGVMLEAGTYQIDIGAGGVNSGGAKTVAFDYEVDGGGAASGSHGGSGGSGGGGGGCGSNGGVNSDGGKWWDDKGGSGGSYGKSGTQGSTWKNGKGSTPSSEEYYGNGGQGQGRTTCEFEQGTINSCYSGVTAYSGGGAGAGENSNGSPGVGGGGYVYQNTNGKPNTGGGGGAGGGAGGSGIVIIRYMQTATSCDNDNVTEANKQFSYTGKYQFLKINEGDYKVKFLTDGIFTPSSEMTVDAFLVGGGGAGAGGVNSGGGGGGGYTLTVKNLNLNAESYQIDIGAGGVNSGGAKTVAFDYEVDGGGAASGSQGGSGGSGGGGGGCGSNGGINPYNGGKWWDDRGGSGGSYGNPGTQGSTWKNGKGSTPSYEENYGNQGSGQGRTTCEFEEGTLSGCNAGVIAYGAGGGGAGENSNGSGGNKGGGTMGKNGIKNTGGGGGAAGGDGGSGIVIIRYSTNNS